MKPIAHYLLLYILMQSGFVMKAYAEGIDIQQTESFLKDGVYYLNAQINYRFSDEAIEALEHGVPLYIDITIKTEKERPYLWNKTVAQSTIYYRLEYHPLSQRYLLTELNRLSRSDFHYLNSALDSLGNITNWPIATEQDLSDEGNYHSLIRAKLDVNSLPASLRPIAFISSKWRLSSPWYEWIIKS